MAKKIYSTSIECLQANKSKNGSQIVFASNVQQTDKGPTAREAINFNIIDSKIAGMMDPGKKYTVTITEE